MVFEPWITIPANDVRIQLPLTIHDTEVRIMFKDVATIDKTIEQLEKLKNHIQERA